MATDWGEEKPELTRKLLARIFKYFLPYWPRGLHRAVQVADARNRNRHRAEVGLPGGGELVVGFDARGAHQRETL